MASHGVARSVRPRTEEQRLQELEKIKKYRDLEDELRAQIAQKHFTPEVFQLTSRLLRLNPEYYTVWNDRRRLLTSGLLSGRSAGSSRSTAWSSSSQNATGSTSSAASFSSSSTATRPAPAPRTAGRTGTTADGDNDDKGAAEAEAAAAPHAAPDDREAQESDLGILRSELAFTIPLLLEFPKCYWIWNYRLWLLRQTIARLDVPVARRIWEEELGLASKMLSKDRRNFHAWGYRRHVVAQLESPELEGTSMVAAEFDYTTKMIRADLSNFSAWHNRSKLIPRLLNERGADAAARRSFFDSELKLIRDALNVGPEDQSLWYYHQYLMLNLFEPVGSSLVSSDTGSKTPKLSMTPELSREERAEYVRRELDDIKDLLEDYNDVKWLYEALMEYSLSLCVLEQRKPSGQERSDLKAWLSKLRELDPMRHGRWNDLEAEHYLG